MNSSTKTDLLPNRKPLRLKNFDYSQDGAYYITICIKNRKCILWNKTPVTTEPSSDHTAINSPVRAEPLSDHTAINSPVRAEPLSDHPVIKSPVRADAHISPPLSNYGKITEQYIQTIKGIDKYVIMPNHIHLIIVNNGTMWASSLPQSISQQIKSFKTLVTKQIGTPIWQRSFHDHIIRNDEDYLRIWKYIDENPIKWELDSLYSKE